MPYYARSDIRATYVPTHNCFHRRGWFVYSDSNVNTTIWTCCEAQIEVDNFDSCNTVVNLGLRAKPMFQRERKYVRSLVITHTN